MLNEQEHVICDKAVMVGPEGWIVNNDGVPNVVQEE